MTGTEQPTAGRIPGGPASSDPLVGETLDGRYLVASVLGRGGMGTVYRAVDGRLDRPVAVKVLRATGDGDADRFALEVRTLARFAHPNLVRLLDAGEVDGRPFLVTDLIDGPTLAQRLSDGPLSSDETAHVGAGIAAALAYVHGQGIVHRDVKPANILLDQDRTAHLADFGISRLVDSTGMTGVGFLLGTPAYLAPEQIQGTDVGPAVDIYALGLMLLECLTGHRAFEGTAEEITAARLQRDPAFPGELPTRWQPLLQQMTSRNPAERPDAPGVVSAIADLEGPAVSSTIPAPPMAASGTDTARGGDPNTAETAMFPRTEVFVRPAVITPLAPRPARRRAQRRRPAPRTIRAGTATAIAAGVVVLVIALAAAGALPGSGAALPPPAILPNSNVTTTTVPPSTTTSSSTTTSLVPTVGAAATIVVSLLNADVANGSVAAPVGQRLTNQLQPLLLSASSEPRRQRIQQFDQFDQSFDQAVAGGQIKGARTIDAITASIVDLAAALRTIVPTATTLPPAPVGGPPGPGPKGGQGKGH